MPNRILALDLQASRIVALVVETSFRGYRFVSHHCEPRDPSRPLAQQLRDLVNRERLRADTVVSALPAAAAVHRILTLPFRDRRKLAQTVPFEIESRIPIPLEEGIVDFQVLSRSSEGSTVFAALARRERLAEHLQLLADAGLDPEIVDFAPLSTLNVLQLFEGERPPRYGFLHVLGSQGALAIYEEGILRRLRVFDADGEADGHALTREVAWTLRSFDGAAPAPEETPLPLLVGGDPPAVLLEALPDRLGLRIQRLEDLPLRHVPEEVREQQGTYATAIGLALREIAEAPTLGLNFRRGEFAYRRAQQELRETLSRLGILSGAVVALFLLSAFVSYHQLSSRYEELRQAVRSVFAATLPDERVILDETAQLQQAIDGLRKRHQQAGGGPVSVLEVLRELSLRAPEEPRMNLDELAFDAEGLRVRGRTSSFEAVEVIKRGLAGSPLFREVQVKDPRTTPDGNVEFRLVLLFGRNPAQ